MITPATLSDTDALVALVNSAYRGQSAKAGWTHEADIIDGRVRIDADTLRKELADASVTILKYTNQHQDVLGTVYLKTCDDFLYLGMLSVRPTQQSSGIGKQLMQAAEAFALKQQRFVIEITVINIRTELIAWYQKLGYAFTGTQKPFDATTTEKPLVPLHFEVLRKHLR
jgi:ribosomal protein S18 acetylase RimI-like enzyme